MIRQPAVFLDRDGVLNEEVGYISSPEQLKVFGYTKACIDRLHKAGFLSVVISNQSGIARGYFTEKDLVMVNRKLVEETGVDKVYYCPHYLKGKIPYYSMECKCRKPGTGMIEKACRDLNIDLEKSFLVGDRASDIETGAKARIKTILVRTGYGLEEEKTACPDYICDD